MLCSSAFFPHRHSLHLLTSITRLLRQGIPSRLVIFPDENHWVLNHGNSLKWHYEVFRWFDKFVGEGRKKDASQRLK